MISSFVLAYLWSIQCVQSSRSSQIKSDTKMSGVREDHQLLHCLWGKECLVEDSYFIWLLADSSRWCYLNLHWNWTWNCNNKMFVQKKGESMWKIVFYDNETNAYNWNCCRKCKLLEKRKREKILNWILNLLSLKF